MAKEDELIMGRSRSPIVARYPPNDTRISNVIHTAPPDYRPKNTLIASRFTIKKPTLHVKRFAVAYESNLLPPKPDHSMSHLGAHLHTTDNTPTSEWPY